ncbi:MAG: purine-binding chemotaxis protein CheW [Gammaproteobacteria bacterium]|nr:purine-binding chemotaxis protein CheW [Gammaproteobacteria bacterium]
MQELIKGQKRVAQYLSFSLGGEEYGVDILKVQEIREWRGARPLPNAPDFVKGVLDLRGTMVPVFDLRIRFGLAEASYDPTTVVIVLALEGDGGGQVVGAIVDAVSDVLDIDISSILSAPAMERTIGARYLQGMVTINQRMVVLLDVDRLLEPVELTELIPSEG